jgi:hypothetical protein
MPGPARIGWCRPHAQHHVSCLKRHGGHCRGGGEDRDGMPITPWRSRAPILAQIWRGTRVSGTGRAPNARRLAERTAGVAAAVDRGGEHSFKGWCRRPAVLPSTPSPNAGRRPIARRRWESPTAPSPLYLLIFGFGWVSALPERGFGRRVTLVRDGGRGRVYRRSLIGCSR